jgi:DNA-binding transcriptional LysR family regulator
MDLKGLETFVWAARLGSFSAAAQRLRTTQPAVSARIAQLEAELGQKLFDRDKRRPMLTPKGQEALDCAERLIALRDEMLKQLAEPLAFRGVVRLGVAETIVHTWLSGLVGGLHQLYPQISLEIEVETSGALRDGLLARELDIAFLLGPVSDPSVRNTPLCSYPLAWVASPELDMDWSVSTPLPEAARRWPIITFGRSTKPHAAIREMLARMEGPAPRIHGNASLATIIRMAEDGIGVGAIPLAVIGRQLKEGTLREAPVTPKLAPLNFTASYVPGPRAFIAAAIAELAEKTAQTHRQ